MKDELTGINARHDVLVIPVCELALYLNNNNNNKNEIHLKTICHCKNETAGHSGLESSTWKTEAVGFL